MYGRRGVGDGPQPCVYTLFNFIESGKFPLLEEVCVAYDERDRPFLGLELLEEKAARRNVRFCTLKVRHDVALGFVEQA